MDWRRTTKVILTLEAMGALSAARGDPARLMDATRPVRELGRDYAVLQWFTARPCETRVQIRAGRLPCNTPGPDGKPAPVWKGLGVRVISGRSGRRTWHALRVPGLDPGTRYQYRVYDPSVLPSGQERRWGAEPPWRREYSFSTLAPAGRKTIIRVPVKVLLMPNVWNVASAHAGDQTAPPPSVMSSADLARIKAEYAVSARFLFINSGMRVWHDYRIVVDDRVQRWGDEPANATGPYRGLPLCRSYGGQDFVGPGGGEFTIVDTRDPRRHNSARVYEPFPYVGQIEQAFPRRWNAAKRSWEFYGSGGGTYGIDGWPNGTPGRSQYLGGSDTAWLATHEYHHQIESHGAFSLANREDDRVIFDHFMARKRVRQPDGKWDEWVWSTSWKHGEHWDGIAHFDRMLTDVQWLRMHFGETLTVADADEDGVPDDDPRLPFDEKRFRSDPRRAKTDGALTDLAKAQLSKWAPSPLTGTWDKAPLEMVAPRPTAQDSDGDGLADGCDPYPLYPWQPFIWPMTATIDGLASEWAAIPLSGAGRSGRVEIQFRQSHDEAAYYACFTIAGPWQRLWVGLDGEGQGYYTTNSTYAFDIRAGDGGRAATLRPSGNGCPGLQWKAGRDPTGRDVVEISIPNRGEGLWFWQGGGREVGASVSGWTRDGKPFSIYEPYELFYARMIERHGRAELPPGAPEELQPGSGVREFSFAQGAGAWATGGDGWVYRDGAMRYAGGPDNTNQLLLTGLTARSFDLWAEFEAANDLHLGAWLPSTTTPDNVTDYVAFLGGFGNERSAIRAHGNEVGAEESGVPKGRHRAQLTRRGGRIWVLLDGKPFIYGRDPAPDEAVDRLGFLGGWGGAQAIYRVRVRLD